MHELLTQSHDILDIVVSEQVDNNVCIFTYLFNSASRHCCEVWSSQFPFLHNLRHTLPPSEACLHGCFKWSLTLTYQQSVLELSQSSTYMRDARAKPKAGFQFIVKKQPMLESCGACLVKKPHLDTGTESYQGGQKSAGVTSTSSTDLSKKGSHGGWCSWCVIVLHLHHHDLPLLCRLVHF